MVGSLKRTRIDDGMCGVGGETNVKSRKSLPILEASRANALQLQTSKDIVRLGVTLCKRKLLICTFPARGTTLHTVHESARAPSVYITVVIFGMPARESPLSFGMETSSKLRTGLLSLSAELRNAIYLLCLRPDEGGAGGVKDSRAIWVSKSSYPHDSTGSRPCLGPLDAKCITLRLNQRSWITQPAFTPVSRQLRSETLPIYYGANRFVL